MWECYLRLDAIWMREFKDLNVARDPGRVFPLLLYFNAHAKMWIAIELAFTGCVEEARSILREAVEFTAHAHPMIADPKLQKIWLSKNDGKAALEEFEKAFLHHKRQGLFKGFEELHKTWGELSETGAHSNINAMVDRFVQITADDHLEFRLSYTGVENRQMVKRCARFERIFKRHLALCNFKRRAWGEHFIFAFFALLASRRMKRDTLRESQVLDVPCSQYTPDQFFRCWTASTT